MYTDPMAGPPTAQFAEITWRFDGPALRFPASTSLGIRWAPPGGDIVEFAADITDYTVNELMPTLVSSVICRGFDIKVGPEDIGPTFTQSLNEPGGNSDAPAPPNCALLVTKFPVGVSGRLGGRMYWPGLSDNQIGAGGGIDTNSLSIYTAVFELLYTFLVAATCPPVVFRSNSSDPTPVDRLVPRGVVATQRRRLRR